MQGLECLLFSGSLQVCIQFSMIQFPYFRKSTAFRSEINYCHGCLLAKCFKYPLAHYINFPYKILPYDDVIVSI